MAKDITGNQRKWIDNVLIHGMSDMAAYKKAYGCSDANAKAKAYLMRQHSGVMVEFRKLQDAQFDSRVMSIAERREWLTRAVKTPIGEVDETSDICIEAQSNEHGNKYKKVDALGALKELNKMDDVYKPEEIKITGLSSVLDMIRKGGEDE
jgi:hypothetical protein